MPRKEEKKAEEKALEAKTEKVKETEDAIIFKANRPLTKSKFEVLSDIVRSEQKKSGKTIILVPYSCDLGGENNE